MAAPVTLATASGRGRSVPARLAGPRWMAAHAGGGDRLTGAQRIGGGLDGADDGGVPGAAAQGILEGIPDLRFGGVGVALQQGVGGHQLAGDAETALHRAVLDEGLLEGVQAWAALARLRGLPRPAPRW